MLVSKRRYDTMEGPASPTAVSQYTSPTFNRFQSNSFGEMNSNINNSSPLFRSALQQQQQQQQQQLQQPYQQQQQQQQQHLLSPVQSFHTPKKTRAEEMESGPVSPHFAALQIVARRRNYESAFQSSSSQEPVEKYIPTAILKRGRGPNTINGESTNLLTNSDGSSGSGSGSSSNGSSNSESGNTHRNNNNNNLEEDEDKRAIFTLSEMKSILARALEDRENLLRAEYDLILQQKLSEQYNNFIKFNEDYINRQLKDSPYNYMS